METNSVLIDKKEMICTITLNRPQVKNAFAMETLMEFQKVLTELESDRETRVIILQGAGGNFCAGADLAEGSSMDRAPVFFEFMERSKNIVKTLRRLPQPVLCKVRGVAVGGGINLALAGDFVVAAQTARFCEVFVNINIIVDWGGTYFLPRLVGLAKARELAFLGDMIDGSTAQSMGLIYKAVPDGDLEGEVDRLAKRLAQKPLVTLGLIKEGIEKSFDMSLDEVLSWEGAHQTVMVQTDEHKQAVQRFLESKGKAR